jgi:adenine-specific DNA-methyltransferase
MASLDFKGKQFVATHHYSVPFRELVIELKKSLPPEGRAPALDDNLIIHGDNLEALKALLPRYTGKIKCIYIDPPYNTGNESWAYNDNLRAPFIKEWLGKTVGADDLERHDKWLCMMMPRLILLRELLAEDGVIFVSIDDNEQHRLRSLMDEVFSEENYLNTFCWVNNLKGRQIAGAGAAKTYEGVLVYAKNTEEIGLFEVSVEKAKALMPSTYKGFDYEIETDDNGAFVVKNELYNTNSAFNEETRPSLVFDIHYNFETGEVKFSETSKDVEFIGFTKISPKQNNDGVHRYHAWRWSKDKISKDIADLKFVKTETGAKVFTKVREHGTTSLKDLITDISTSKGSGELETIFKDKTFDYPKPLNLIKILINQFETDCIVLDSFAGSGTTAQAVLELNSEDGGNRKFILVEVEDYADKITAERVRRVIKGVPTATDEKLREGLGGSFTFCELGQPISIDGLLKGTALPYYATLAGYVFYTATGATLEKPPKKPASDFLIGEHNGQRIHLIYKPDKEFLRSNEAMLNSDRAEIIARSTPAGSRALVFAAGKFMSQSELTAQRIEFSQLPYTLHRVFGS